MKVQLLKTLDLLILNQYAHKPLLIAIDGIDGSGKTCFTHELIAEFKENNPSIYLISLDKYQFPKIKKDHPKAVLYYKNLNRLVTNY